MTRAQRIASSLTLVSAAIALAPAGCGGDNSQTIPTGPPALTVPDDTDGTDTDLDADAITTKTRVRTESTGPPPAPDPGTEAATTPTTPTTPTAPAKPQRTRDNPKFDSPPPPGTPAERFEAFCEQHPKACAG